MGENFLRNFRGIEAVSQPTRPAKSVVFAGVPILCYFFSVWRRTASAAAAMAAGSPR